MNVEKKNVVSTFFTRTNVIRFKAISMLLFVTIERDLKTLAIFNLICLSCYMPIPSKYYDKSELRVPE